MSEADTPTPEDVERVASALVRVGQQPGTPADVRAPTVYEARFLATAALAAMETTIERERRAAKVEALREYARWLWDQDGDVAAAYIKAEHMAREIERGT